MGSWVLDWSISECEQCWCELIRLWQSEGIRKNLTSNHKHSLGVTTVDVQPKGEMVETVEHQAVDYASQHSWTKVSLGGLVEVTWQST